MVKKIIIWFCFLAFLIDKHIDKEDTNYFTWIVLFLFFIAWNTANINEK